MAFASPLARATALGELEGTPAPRRAAHGGTMHAIRAAVIKAKQGIKLLELHRDLTTEEAAMHAANLDAMLSAPAGPALLRRAQQLPRLLQTLRARAAAERTTSGH